MAPFCGSMNIHRTRSTITSPFPVGRQLHAVIPIRRSHGGSEADRWRRDRQEQNDQRSTMHPGELLVIDRRIDGSLAGGRWPRSEEHTSELQSRENLVCRLLLEKKKKKVSRRQLNKTTHNHRRK